MTIHNSTLFSMLGAKVGWLAQRQQVIAKNISNADTPNYQSQDLQGINFRSVLRGTNQRVELAKVDGQSFSSSTQGQDYRVRDERKPYETTISGNGVVLEEQLMKMNQTVADHRLALNLSRKYVGMYRMALGQGGGG